MSGPYRFAASRLHPALLLVLALITATLFSPAQASEQKVAIGDYEFHYSIFPSAQLTPEVAREYGLTRSRAIGIVNAVILKKPESSSAVAMPVDGAVEGQVTNDLRQVRQLQFKTVREGQAVYYLAQFQYQNAELLTFTLEARPQRSDVVLPVRISQALFSD